jgi:Ca-activated chloride channel homolog
MKASRTLAQWLGTLALLSFTAVLTQAQGIILPRPCEGPVVRCAPPEWQRPLRVKSIHLKTKITDQAAVTHVTQVFVNESPYTLEGTYFFPLPDGVSISEFAMWDGDKRLVGEFRAREEARRIYDSIVRSRRDPALLEYAGKNLFQASVFPISPHSEKKIELTYSQVLTGDEGTVGYRYPLGTGWRANGFITDVPRPIPMPRPLPRPMPRQMPPIRESDEQGTSRLPQPRPNVGVVSGEIEIVSRIALKGIYSPSHEIEVKRDGERHARITFETRTTSGQPDLQLFYALSEQEFGASLLTYREPGKDGYFMLLLAPKAELDEKAVAAKEVVFVLDTSGSMADDGKMEKARAALRFGVNALNARDRFNIVSFAGEEHLLSERLLNADASGKKQALEFIERLKATGGTNINDALLAAFKQLPASERPQMVVLLTDGQPTVGTTSASKIMSNAKEANRSNARLFTFGVGYDINTLLLDGLAGEGRGAVTYIEPKEDIELKVSSFFSKVNYPVLSDLKLDWGGSETELLYPRALPDLFHGSQLVLVGRYRPKPDFKLTLTGKVAGRERRFVYGDLKFPETQRDHEFLGHLWAMRRVGHLLDQIRLNGENKELRDEIVALGTRYGIVTPYTSALVLEPGMQVGQSAPMPPPGSPRRAQVSGGAMYERPTERDKGAISLSGVSGEAAVKASKQKAEMERSEQVTINPSADASMRQVAGKTFYLRDGVWTDSEFKADAKLPEVSLKFASEEYFKLINQTPKLADFFALGQRVTVVWQGKVYRVAE